MSKNSFPDQLDDEELLMMFRKHPIVMRKGLVLAMIVLLLGTVPSLIKPEYSYLFGGLGVGLLVSLLVFFPSWISWYYTVYIVTNQRLIQMSQKGFWTKSVVDIGLSQIQMVNYQVAGLQETLLGFGTIMMQTFVGDLVIHDVHHPAKVQKEILKILREQGVEAIEPPAMSLDEQEDEENN